MLLFLHFFDVTIIIWANLLAFWYSHKNHIFTQCFALNYII